MAALKLILGIRNLWRPLKESRRMNSDLFIVSCHRFGICLVNAFYPFLYPSHCADTCIMVPYLRPAYPIILHAHNIGGTTFCTSRHCFHHSNCACFGRGIWPMTCSSMCGPSYCLSSQNGKYLCAFLPVVCPHCVYVCLCVCVSLIIGSHVTFLLPQT